MQGMTKYMIINDNITYEKINEIPIGGYLGRSYNQIYNKFYID